MSAAVRGAQVVSGEIFTDNIYRILGGSGIVPTGCWAFARGLAGGLQGGAGGRVSVRSRAKSPSLVSASGTVRSMRPETRATGND